MNEVTQPVFANDASVVAKMRFRHELLAIYQTNMRYATIVSNKLF